MNYNMLVKNMPICYDLHSHSYYSDGDLSPSDLVLRAAAKGVDVLALTDHDTTDGIAEAMIAASKSGIILIPGIEISVTWQNTLLHIVGLRIDPDNKMLQAGLEGVQKTRQERAEKIAQRFKKIGLPDAYQAVLEYAGGDIISRNHFARYLIEKGFAKDHKSAFKRYLLKGKPCYVAADWAELKDAIDWIRAAGGQAVIAHPARYQLSNAKLKALFENFSLLGGEVIEVVSSAHSPTEVTKVARLANECGLLASSGSDFHSPKAVWAELGKIRALPEGSSPVWKNWNLPSTQNQTSYCSG